MIYLLFFLIIFNLMLKTPKNSYDLNIYFGVPGSGKSTFAAKLAKEALRESRIITYCKQYPGNKICSKIVASKFFKRSQLVYSNLPIAGARVLDPRNDLGKYLVEKCLIIIDEAGLDYSSRDFKNFPVENRIFFKFHRHEYAKVAIFSQDPNDMDKVIRELAHNRFIVVRSIFPNWFIAKRVRKRIAVDEYSRQLMSIDIRPTMADWSWCYGPSVWHLFNSHSRLNLPPKMIWKEYPLNDTQKSSRFSSIFLHLKDFFNKSDPNEEIDEDLPK